jgi:hypothetical protein
MKPRRIRLKPGLSKKEAWQQVRKKPGKDFRGMKYNPRTGVAIVI